MKAVAPFLVFLSIFALGCAGSSKLSRVDEKRQVSPQLIAPGDVVTVVGLSGIRGDMLDCIDGAIRHALSEVHVISPAAFRESMFPWFEPNNAPGDTESLSKLMLSSIVKQRIDDLRVRYVVTISGAMNSQTNSWGAANIGGGVGTKESIALQASILDLTNVQRVGEIRVTAEGSGQIGIFVVIPYVFIPETATIVCKAIAKRVVAYFRGEPQAPPEGGLKSD